MPAIAAGKAPVTAGSLRWAAVYLSNLQGKFTPQMVSQITGLGTHAAHRITQQLVAQNVITAAHAAGGAALSSALTVPKHRTRLAAAKVPEARAPIDAFERLTKGLDKIGTDNTEQNTEETKDTDNEQA